MDDLIAYVINLFRTDPILLAYFTAAGQSKVAVGYPGNRVNATYPFLVVYGYEGSQTPYGENNRPKFFRGTLKIEIVAKESNSNTAPLATVNLIKKRITYLLLGSPGPPSFQGIQGRFLSQQIRCDSFYEKDPTGYIDEMDPTLKKWGGSYSALLNQIQPYTFP